MSRSYVKCYSGPAMSYSSRARAGDTFSVRQQLAARISEHEGLRLCTPWSLPIASTAGPVQPVAPPELQAVLDEWWQLVAGEDGLSISREEYCRIREALTLSIMPEGDPQAVSTMVAEDWHRLMGERHTLEQGPFFAELLASAMPWVHYDSQRLVEFLRSILGHILGCAAAAQRLKGNEQRARTAPAPNFAPSPRLSPPASPAHSPSSSTTSPSRASTVPNAAFGSLEGPHRSHAHDAGRRPGSSTLAEGLPGGQQGLASLPRAGSRSDTRAASAPRPVTRGSACGEAMISGNLPRPIRANILASLQVMMFVMGVPGVLAAQNGFKLLLDPPEEPHHKAKLQLIHKQLLQEILVVTGCAVEGQESIVLADDVLRYLTANPQTRHQIFLKWLLRNFEMFNSEELSERTMGDAIRHFLVGQPVRDGTGSDGIQEEDAAAAQAALNCEAVVSTAAAIMGVRMECDFMEAEMERNSTELKANPGAKDMGPAINKMPFPFRRSVPPCLRDDPPLSPPFVPSFKSKRPRTCDSFMLPTASRSVRDALFDRGHRRPTTPPQPRSKHTTGYFGGRSPDPRDRSCAGTADRARQRPCHVAAAALRTWRSGAVRAAEKSDLSQDPAPPRLARGRAAPQAPARSKAEAYALRRRRMETDAPWALQTK